MAHTLSNTIERRGNGQLPIDRFIVGPADLVKVRFGVVPGHELIRAVRMVLYPPRLPLQRALLQRFGARANRAGLAALQLVIGKRGYLPDFLIQPDFSSPPEACDAVAQVDLDEVRNELLRINTQRTGVIPSAWLEAPAIARQVLVKAFLGVWNAFEPDWIYVKQILDADIALRSRQLASQGLQKVICDLDPRLRWDGDAVIRSSSRCGVEVECSGRGLLLAPSVFAWPTGSIGSDPPWQPAIYYPASGATLVPAAGETLAAASRLLGETRAKVLALLVVPARTGEVASALGISPATASHHLSVLRDAGLIITARSGVEAWHTRADVADSLGW